MLKGNYFKFRKKNLSFIDSQPPVISFCHLIDGFILVLIMPDSLYEILDDVARFTVRYIIRTADLLPK